MPIHAHTHTHEKRERERERERERDYKYQRSIFFDIVFAVQFLRNNWSFIYVFRSHIHFPRTIHVSPFFFIYIFSLYRLAFLPIFFFLDSSTLLLLPPPSSFSSFPSRFVLDYHHSPVPSSHIHLTTHTSSLKSHTVLLSSVTPITPE